MDPVLADLLARKPRVRRQHFVPRFYLEYFADPATRKLAVFMCDRGEIRKRPATPRSVCYAPYFYGMKSGDADETAQLTEIMLEDLENQIAPITKRNIARLHGNERVGGRDKWNLAFLMSMLWIRGPVMREMIRKRREEFTKQTASIVMALKGQSFFDEMEEELGSEIPAEAREKVLKTVQGGDYELHWSNREHLLMLGKIPNYASVFASCNWRVFISKCGKSFITSDDPLIVISPEPEGPFGATFYDRTYYFSLTPDICIVAHGAADKRSKPLVRKTLMPGPSSEHLVLRINSTVATYAKSYAYARDRDSLQDIIDATPPGS